MPSDNDDFDPSDLKSRLGVGDDDASDASEEGEEHQQTDEDVDDAKTRPDSPTALDGESQAPPDPPSETADETSDSGGSSGPPETPGSDSDADPAVGGDRDAGDSDGDGAPPSTPETPEPPPPDTPEPPETPETPGEQSDSPPAVGSDEGDEGSESGEGDDALDVPSPPTPQTDADGPSEEPALESGDTSETAPSGGEPPPPQPDGSADPPSPESAGESEPSTDAETDGEDDLSIDSEPAGLTGATVALALVVLVVGAGFGYVATTTYQFRRIYQERTQAAKRVLEAVEPKVEAYEELQSTIQTLDPNDVEYEKAKALAKKEIAVDPSVFGRRRLVLGPQRTSLLTSFLVDAERLAKQTEEHKQLTAEQPHRRRLERIAGDGDASGEEGDGKEGSEQGSAAETQYGVLFDFEHLKRNALADDYKPHAGKVVELLNFDDPKEGKVKFRLPDSERVREVKIESVVPVSRSDILTSGGRNAFELYKERVQNLKLRVKKIGPTPKQLVEKLEELAHRPPPPILKFTS